MNVVQVSQLLTHSGLSVVHIPSSFGSCIFMLLHCYKIAADKLMMNESFVDCFPLLKCLSIICNFTSVVTHMR